jgi:hypothetical protein
MKASSTLDQIKPGLWFGSYANETSTLNIQGYNQSAGRLMHFTSGGERGTSFLGHAAVWEGAHVLPSLEPAAYRSSSDIDPKIGSLAIKAYKQYLIVRIRGEFHGFIDPETGAVSSESLQGAFGWFAAWSIFIPVPSRTALSLRWLLNKSRPSRNGFHEPAPRRSPR